MGGKGVCPLRRLAAFEVLHMVNVNSVGIFCRPELKKAEGGAHYDNAPPVVPDYRRTFNLEYFFCAFAQKFLKTY